MEFMIYVWLKNWYGWLGWCMHACVCICLCGFYFDYYKKKRKINKKKLLEEEEEKNYWYYI